ncbi:TPA: response regulator transcription factor [Pseudomonas putida]|nr:response regulator transcription factor [Pseudomonas putida]
MSTVVIAAPHPLIRFALKALLEQRNHAIVGETESCLETLRIMEHTAPDLLVLDLGINDAYGLELIERLRAADCCSAIMVLAENDEKKLSERCLERGANGYTSKRSSTHEMIHAINNLLVEQGHPLKQRAVTRSTSRTLPAGKARQSTMLTRRELEVLRLLADRRSLQEIATELSMGYKNASAYKVRLLNKFKTTLLIELIEEARRKKYI